MNSPQKPSTLIYFTAKYPFGHGEQFIKNEIDGLCAKYQKVYLVPFDTSEDLNKSIPQNCEVLDVKLQQDKKAIKNKYLFYFKIILSEIFSSGKAVFILKNLRSLQSELKSAYKWSCIIEQVINDQVEESTSLNLYSTWMNENALALAILKRTNKIGGFSFKMRGYDLFDERRAGGYMPFRKFIFSQADSVLTMSKQGAEYLRKKAIYSHKINHNYPGINSTGINELKDGVFTLVSCSGLVKLKRVEMIAQALNLIEFDIKWVHFGNGPEMENIKNLVKSLPQNVQVVLKGTVENEEIRDYYVNEKVDGFIHVSETEGFGYAIIEAYCSGIPAILYPAGGVQELINNDFSYRASSPLEVQSLANDISKFRDEFEGKSKPKEDAYSFYLENFQVQPNVDELLEYIKN